jgi:WS/DGAT/MGAT family acyltransferase
MVDTTSSATPARPLSDADSLMWRIEADPVLRSPIMVVALLDRVPAAKSLRATFERAAALLPGLRSTIVPPGGGIGKPRWEPDPTFSLDHHIRWVGATGSGLRGVLDLAEPDAMLPFDPERPPWSLLVVEGLAADRAAFVLRFHHAITDGMGGLRAADAFFDHARRPARTATAAVPGAEVAGRENGQPESLPWPLALAARATGGALGVASTAAAMARSPVGTVTGTVRLVRSAGRLLSAAPAGSPLFVARGIDRHLHVFEVPLAELRAAAAAAGGTINDALLTAVSGAFAGYHDRRGVSVPTMSVTMPVDRRGADEGPEGNRFTPVRFTLPVDERDPATRLRIASAIASSWRHEPAVGATDMIAGALNLLPGAVVTRVFRGMLRSIDADVVDLAGLTRPAYVGGARIERMWAFAPPTGAAFSVTLLSHLETCCVAVATDPAAVSQPELLAGCLETAFDEVLALARPALRDEDEDEEALS